jgi:hypothetical protein
MGYFRKDVGTVLWPQMLAWLPSTACERTDTATGQRDQPRQGRHLIADVVSTCGGAPQGTHGLAQTLEAGGPRF